MGDDDGDREPREGEGSKESLREFSSTTSQLHRIRVEYFIRRPSSDENEKDGLVQPAPLTAPFTPLLHHIPTPSPSYGLLTGNLPRLLLTVLSLHSPSLRWRNVFPSFSHPFPSSARIQAVSPLARRVAFPLVLPPIDPSPFSSHTASRHSFVLRAVRSSLRQHELLGGFGHLESLRLQNTPRRISSRTHFPPRRC